MKLGPAAERFCQEHMVEIERLGNQRTPLATEHGVLTFAPCPVKYYLPRSL